VAMLDPSDMGLAWLQGLGAWVMLDPESKFKKHS